MPGVVLLEVRFERRLIIRELQRCVYLNQKRSTNHLYNLDIKQPLRHSRLATAIPRGRQESVHVENSEQDPIIIEKSRYKRVKTSNLTFNNNQHTILITGLYIPTGNRHQVKAVQHIRV